MCLLPAPLPVPVRVLLCEDRFGFDRFEIGLYTILLLAIMQ